MSADGQPTNARPPPVVADHDLLLRIGEGAYGEVWLARNVTGAYRAVKVVYRYRFADDRPYEREFKGITRFEPISRSNEGLVDILQVGREDRLQCFYYVMELADDVVAADVRRLALKPGADQSLLTSAATDAYNPRTLQSELRRRGRLPFEECLQLGLSLTLALAHLHRHGLIHRDIKPANIIFVGGVPKLADIGLVTDLAEARSYVGTEGFIPPEGPNSPQADIFSLGKVLYEASMGKDRQDFPEPFTALVDDPAAKALMELNAVIVKACAAGRSQRYQSAEEMHADLALLHSGRSVKRKRLIEQRLAWVSKVSVGAATLAILAIAAFLYQRNHSAQLARLAQREAHQRSRAEAALTQLELQRTEELFASGRAASALPHLAWILRQQPTNHLAAQRLISALSARDFILPALAPMQHDATVTSTRFDAARERLLVVGGKHIRTWLLRTGQPVGPSLEHPAEVTRAAFIADAQEALTFAKDNQVRHWDLAHGKLLNSPKPAPDQTTAAHFSEDGRLVVFVLGERSVQVWDVRTWKALGEPISITARILSAQTTRDAARLLLVTSDNSLRLWEIASGKPLTPRLRHHGPIISMDVSPDEQFVITGSEDKTAQVWDMPSGGACGPPLQHDNFVNSVRFSPEGRRVMTGSIDRTARIWDAQTGEPLTPPLEHDNTVNIVRFSPEGLRVLTGTRISSVRLWDALSGKPLSEVFVGADLPVTELEFLLDGHHVVAVEEPQTIRVLDVRPTRTLNDSMRHAGHVTTAVFDSTGNRIVTASKDRSARLWHANTAKPIGPPLTHGHIINTAEFSPDGKLVVTASRSSSVKVWDADNGEPLFPSLRHSNMVNCAHFDAASASIVTASDDGAARIFDARSGQLLCEPLRHSLAVNHAEFSSDGQRVVTASIDGSARIWDAGAWTPVGQPMVHEAEVFSAHFSPDGTMVATASRAARVWNGRTGQPISPPMKHNGYVVSARFSPDGKRVVTASRDNTARVWSARTGEPLIEPLQHDGAVENAIFSPDGRRIVTASRDGTARIWDAQTGYPLSEPLLHGSWVYRAQFSPDGERVVTASRDCTAILWDTPAMSHRIPDWLPDLAEAVAGRRLDERRIPIPHSGSELVKLRDSRLASKAEDDYSRWAEWFFARGLDRRLSFNSSRTINDWLQSRVDESPLEALHVVPDHPVALSRFADEHLKRGGGTNTLATAIAHWLNRRSAQFAPDVSEAKNQRAEFLDKASAK